MRVCMHKRTHACLFVPACLPPACPSARLHAHAKAYYGTSSIHEYHTYPGLCLCRGCLARTSHHSFHAAVSPGQHRGGRRDKRLQSCLCPASRSGIHVHHVCVCVCVCVWLCVWRWFVVDGLGFEVRGAGFRVEGSEAVGRPRALLLLRLATKR